MIYENDERIRVLVSYSSNGVRVQKQKVFSILNKGEKEIAELRKEASKVEASFKKEASKVNRKNKLKTDHELGVISGVVLVARKVSQTNYFPAFRVKAQKNNKIVSSYKTFGTNRSINVALDAVIEELALINPVSESMEKSIRKRAIKLLKDKDTLGKLLNKIPEDFHESFSDYFLHAVDELTHGEIK